MAAALYATDNRSGVDVNLVTVIDTAFPEYPAAPFIPGTGATGTDGSSWLYAQAAVALNAGAVVQFSMVPGQWSVAAIGGATTAGSYGQLIGIVGGSQGTMSVAAITGTQSMSFFWVQIAGNAPNVGCAASTTANVPLHSSATTAGVVSSSAGGQGTTFLINGIVITQATGSVAGPNTAVLDYPFNASTTTQVTGSLG